MKRLYLVGVMLSFSTPFAAPLLQPLEIKDSKQLKLPVYAASPKGSSDFWILNQDGKVLRWDSKSQKLSQILNIEKEVLSVSDLLGGNEEGLLGLAFTPQFQSLGHFLLYYSVASPRRTVITEWRWDAKKNLVDLASKKTLYEISQPYANHNGGMIEFGPDGLLYVGVGDGGSSGDPKNFAQNPKSPLGKILRFQYSAGNLRAAEGNPFDSSKALPEIFAMGARNPWRFSFDAKGTLWVADVGQNKWEEIHVVKSGDNLGWPLFEGLEKYKESAKITLGNLAKPVWVYPHSPEGGYSITGGYVYNGKRHPNLVGQYIFADYVTGHIWALKMDSNNKAKVSKISNVPHIASFARASDGELLILTREDSRILKF
jgi:glucose/arabinose dehydrogenase